MSTASARTLAAAAALAGAYYVLARVGLALPYFTTTVTLFWAPAGVAVAGLYAGGLRLAPAVWLAAFAVNLGLVPPLAAAGVATGNTLGPALAVWLLRRAGFRPQFDRQQDVYLFLLLGAVVPMAVPAVVGILCLAAGGVVPPGEEFRGLLVWWLGDATGVIFAAPPVLAARRLRRQDWAAAAGSAAVLGAVCTLTFGPVIATDPRRLVLAFVPLVYLVWAAVKFGGWVGYVHVLLVAVVTIAWRSGHPGPLNEYGPHVAQFVLWGYLLTLALLVLLVTSLLAERNRAEKALAASEAEYRALVEDNPAMICRFHPDGELSFANEAFRRMFGPAAARLPVGDRLPPGLRSLKVGLNAFGFESEHAGRWVRWTARAVDASSGVVSEFHAVGLDVTEEKRAAEDHREFLAHMVQTQKLESIGVLAGGVAHEFNNILTGVLGHIELAGLTLPPDAAARANLDAAAAAAGRAAGLTRQLLTYAGKGAMPAGAVDLSAVVRASADLVGVTVAKRCPVRYALSDALPPTAAEEADVRQVVVNLVSNAAEAVEAAGGSVTVRTGEVAFDPAGRTAWAYDADLEAAVYPFVEVTDDGPGMTPAVLARVFDPFYTTKFPGRGLGLAAVLGIVKQHRGAVRVRSEPGKGTTVTVLFQPLVDGKPRRAPSSTDLRRAGAARR